MNDSNNILVLSLYTVELYREKFREHQPIGSGLLLKFQSKHLLISAYHVIDMEDERISIENDTDEVDIPQDDMESILAKGVDSFFIVNDNVKAMVWTAHYNEETNEPTFTDDIEWCICELSEDIVQHFIAKGKSFYVIDKLTAQTIKADSEIIISGFPKYAQIVNQEICRSYKCELIEDFIIDKSGLFRVHLDCDRAFCLELDKVIMICKPEGISGMSGGGLWYKSIDNYIPLGIILKQGQDYVEGYSIAEILKSYIKDKI